MKKYNRTIICAFAISMSLAFAVPAMAYADETDVQHVSEWVTDEKGRIFYYDESGKFVTGEQEIDGEMYLFSKNGVQKTGWRTVDGARKYYDTETGKPVYGWIDYCGKQYYIEKESKDKQVNCVTENEDGKLVLLNDKGSVMIGAGFTELDDNIYFVSDDGTLVTGETVIDDVPYVFDNTGKCGTGWQKISGKKYYYNPETAEPVFGFFEVDGSYYYTDKENGMCTSVAKINGIEYLFNEQTGKMQYGWLDINDSKRYFYKDATYAKGLTKIDGESYIFSDKGVLLTGFAELEGNKYYLDEKDGKMHFEWLETNGKKYYFNGDTGIMMTGRLIINGGKYYFAEDGSMQIGLQEIDGKKY
ncbi:MAG: hypothetical protein K2J47_06585, partial [Ruminococcus sp.]|nr:hypothetical protein [Ruminococcus sp.]